MRKILISEIIVRENRQRQSFDPQAMQDLQDSILTSQLLHPIVLREEEGEWVLVAGERRLRTMEDIFTLGGSFLHDGQIFTAEDTLVPFTSLGDLAPLAAEEAELDENLRRKDLTWQEHAQAVARLHSLRTRQHSVLMDKLPQEDRALPYTIADTAKELSGRSDGYYQDSVRKELIVAQHADNPVIAKAKNADEAYKLLKKEEEREKNIELAARIGGSFSANQHTLLNMNCLDSMREITESGELFDVILTDPPYGMGADTFGDGGGKLAGIEHHYEDSYESWQILMKAWAPLSFAVTKPQAHAYVFCDFDHFHELKALMQAAGWYVFRTPLLHYKLNSGRVPLPDQGPRRQYETILYAIKGKKQVTHIYPDVIPSQGDESLTHGAQKPVALYQNLLQRSVRAGDRVLDTFAGTGTVFVASHTLLCEATGIELSKEYYGIAAKRLESLAHTGMKQTLLEEFLP